MARIRSGVLGTPTGKIGKTVYRRLNKKTVASGLSENRKKSNSEAVIQNENLFAQVTKLCNFVNKSTIIKNVWKFSKLPGTYTNLKLFKHNYNSIRSWDVSSDFHILPDNLQYFNEDILLCKDKLEIRFYVDYAVTVYKKQTGDFLPPYAFLSLIYAKDPVSPKSKIKKVSQFLSEIQTGFQIIPKQKSSFTFASQDDSFSYIDDFNTVIVFPAIVSLNETKKTYEWAENGGFYVKGSKPEISLYNPPPVPPASNKESFIKFD
ncbi:MAG: hypothetical protein WC644_04945 [Ignavibacteria bacterium]